MERERQRERLKEKRRQSNRNSIHNHLEEKPDRATVKIRSKSCGYWELRSVKYTVYWAVFHWPIPLIWTKKFLFLFSDKFIIIFEETFLGGALGKFSTCDTLNVRSRLARPDDLCPPRRRMSDCIGSQLHSWLVIPEYLILSPTAASSMFLHPDRYANVFFTQQATVSGFRTKRPSPFWQSLHPVIQERSDDNFS